MRLIKVDDSGTYIDADHVLEWRYDAEERDERGVKRVAKCVHVSFVGGEEMFYWDDTAEALHVWLEKNAEDIRKPGGLGPMAVSSTRR